MVWGGKDCTDTRKNATKNEVTINNLVPDWGMGQAGYRWNVPQWNQPGRSRMAGDAVSVTDGSLASRLAPTNAPTMDLYCPAPSSLRGGSKDHRNYCDNPLYDCIGYSGYTQRLTAKAKLNVG